MSGLEIPITDVALDALDAYLCSDRSPPECMGLSDLDGFLTGIAIGPEVIAPSEWLPIVWGHEQPVFADEGDVRTVLGGIMSRFNEILRETQDKIYEPILWTAPDETVIASDWAEGFAQAIALRPAAWGLLINDEEHTHLLFPILGLYANESGESVLGLDAETEDMLFEEAPSLLAGCVTEIAAFWRERRVGVRGDLRVDRVKGAAHMAARPGRNDPCPCGSGRKFKKCCGRNS